ncbi:MAG: acyl-CoA dehydrogenase [Pseudomonadota bacterium]|nr:acyl-CoA dehydrogenase [Pseudomonadota bacterium]
MIEFLIGLILFLMFLGLLITIAYQRIDIGTSTLMIGFGLVIYSLFGYGHWIWFLFLWLIFFGLLAITIIGFRREYLTTRLFNIYKTMVPSLSDTERDALEAGTVSWDGELFSGQPDWTKLMSIPPPKLTAAEKAFIDGPVEKLCEMVNDWEVTYEISDLTKETWDFIRKERFFGMIIPTEFGGLGFSATANASVLAKLCSRSVVLASTVAVPNSLGPSELLMHYGTKDQKQRWLPKLANGDEIPCFALTSPTAGSDAGAITDRGIICRRIWEGKEIIGIELNWDKRYITLAPVATVLGLAFKLYDPDGLIGEIKDHGITAALIPTNLDGINIGRRHLPLHTPFQNGPTSGKNVFVPLDAIIGGVERAGQGWRMLIEQLSAGRGISLPAESQGSSQAALYASSAYARIRRQFGLPIAQFEGIEERLGRMAGRTYIINAGVSVTTNTITHGEMPAVPSAIMKYHCTEYGRMIVNDAMDIQGGKGIMSGPKNYLSQAYDSIPISITVEGANILTRSLIIFGQGAIRCHPFVLKEMEAARNNDYDQGLRDFDHLLFRHIGNAISNAAKSFVMALTHARFTNVPKNGPTKRFYQHVNRFSSAFALISDAAMLILGGELKRREKLSGRLGDVFSNIYLTSMVLKYFEDQGCPEEDLPLVEWSCRSLLYEAQEQLHGFLRNFPNQFIATLLRICIFPRGRTYFSPNDELSRDIVRLLIRPTMSRERLCNRIFKSKILSNHLGNLQSALEIVEENSELSRRLKEALKNEVIIAQSEQEAIDAAENAGIITTEEAQKLRDQLIQVMGLISVDDFAPERIARKKYANESFI